MPKVRLTASAIKNAGPKASRYWLDDVNARKGKGCLSVRIQPSGAKSFYFSWWHNGARNALKIGNVKVKPTDPGTSLADAFDKAREYGELWDQGISPRDHLQAIQADEEERRLEEKRCGTLEQLFIAYTDNMKANGKRTYAKVLRDLRKEAGGVLPLETKAKEVTTAHIVEMVGRMIDRGAETHSNRVRAMLHAAFQYGLHHDNDPKHNRRGQLFGLALNPVAAVPKQTAAERVLDRNLSGAELHRLLHDLDNPEFFNPWSRAYILIMLYAGQRVDEALRVQWADLDFKAGLWSMAPERSKVGSSHLIPIAPQLATALKQHRKITGHSQWVFSQDTNPAKHKTNGDVSIAIRKYIKRANAKEATAAKAEGRKLEEWERFTARDLRRTWKSRLGDLGISKHVRDLVQSHVGSDTSSKHYDRAEYLPEKRHAISVWAEALERWRTDPAYDPHTDNRNIISLAKHQTG
ncbi:tyrosine-type recombinase/integrase [Ferrimonas sp.]|uniref:tyrosine-type recombinase/integrase n=1 Tax=Ferrimonas sp. TaxID=2080861 RepID=UPI003A8FA71C